MTNWSHLVTLKHVCVCVVEDNEYPFHANFIFFEIRAESKYKNR